MGVNSSKSYSFHSCDDADRLHGTSRTPNPSSFTSSSMTLLSNFTPINKICPPPLLDLPVESSKDALAIYVDENQPGDGGSHDRSLNSAKIQDCAQNMGQDGLLAPIPSANRLKRPARNLRRTKPGVSNEGGDENWDESIQITQDRPKKLQRRKLELIFNAESLTQSMSETANLKCQAKSSGGLKDTYEAAFDHQKADDRSNDSRRSVHVLQTAPSRDHVQNAHLNGTWSPSLTMSEKSSNYLQSVSQDLDLSTSKVFQADPSINSSSQTTIAIDVASEKVVFPVMADLDMLGARTSPVVIPQISREAPNEDSSDLGEDLQDEDLLMLLSRHDDLAPTSCDTFDTDKTSNVVIQENESFLCSPRPKQPRETGTQTVVPGPDDDDFALEDVGVEDMVQLAEGLEYDQDVQQLESPGSETFNVNSICPIERQPPRPVLRSCAHLHHEEHEADSAPTDPTLKATFSFPLHPKSFPNKYHHATKDAVFADTIEADILDILATEDLGGFSDDDLEAHLLNIEAPVSSAAAESLTTSSTIKSSPSNLQNPLPVEPTQLRPLPTTLPAIQVPAVPLQPPALPVESTVTPKQVSFDEHGNPLPFARPAFPASIRDRSPILGLTSRIVLRTCFRIGEALNAAAAASRTNTEAIIELYARITYSEREAKGVAQHFQFADLYKSDSPPYLSGTYGLWKGSELWSHDSKAFLGPSGKGKMARVIGKIKRDPVGTGCKMTILSIWEAEWEDVQWVKGIICA